MEFSVRGRSDERSLDEGWIVLRALDRVIAAAEPFEEPEE